MLSGGALALVALDPDNRRAALAFLSWRKPADHGVIPAVFSPQQSMDLVIGAATAAAALLRLHADADTARISKLADQVAAHLMISPNLWSLCPHDGLHTPEQIISATQILDLATTLAMAPARPIPATVDVACTDPAYTAALIVHHAVALCRIGEDPLAAIETALRRS